MEQGRVPLSRREEEILERVARGQTNRQIGGELGLSPRAVGDLVARVFGKLGSTDRVEAAILALHRGSPIAPKKRP